MMTFRNRIASIITVAALVAGVLPPTAGAAKEVECFTNVKAARVVYPTQYLTWSSRVTGHEGRCVMLGDHKEQHAKRGKRAVAKVAAKASIKVHMQAEAPIQPHVVTTVSPRPGKVAEAFATIRSVRGGMGTLAAHIDLLDQHRLVLSRF